MLQPKGQRSEGYKAHHHVMDVCSNSSSCVVTMATATNLKRKLDNLMDGKGKQEIMETSRAAPCNAIWSLISLCNLFQTSVRAETKDKRGLVFLYREGNHLIVNIVLPKVNHVILR